MLHRLRQTFIGDRSFYKATLRIVIPIIIQMLVTNFVNLLDNIMVGQLGTEALSGVAVGNQLIFVFNLCIFGGLSGPGIYSAQFFGADDLEGVHHTFRLKVWISGIILLLAVVVFTAFGPQLIQVFLTGQGEAQSAALMLHHGLDYLHIMMVGFLPFALTTTYASTLRESGHTSLPMKAGIAAVLTNLVGNWLLIYGNLGFPRMEVQGAAIATVISRFVEMSIILYVVHGRGLYTFMQGAWHTMRVPVSIVRAVLKKGAPLLLNEFLWSMGVATLTQIYSIRGLHVLAGLNIANTINNLFIVVFLSMGNAVAVLIGQHLGAGDMHRARADVWRLMAFSVSLCIVIGAVMAILSPYFPLLYQTTEDVRHLASTFLLIMALYMPMYAVSHCSYFTLRSGGSTLMTFIFDSGFMWVISVPVALALTHWTNLPTVTLYPLVEAMGASKMLLGIYLVRRGVWVRNIVNRLGTKETVETTAQ